MRAAELIEQSAWLEDVSGLMTLAEVKQRPQDFAPYRGVLAQGYSASAFWVRLHIGPSPEKKLILRTRLSYLDHI